MVWRGVAMQGNAGVVRHGVARRSDARQCRQGVAWRGEAGIVAARQVWRCVAWLGAARQAWRGVAMHSAVITGRNTEITPPSTDMTFPKFVTAAKHTAPKAMKNSIFLVVLGSSSIAIHRTFGTNLFW